ncbi:MAG: hypothetical protein D6722_22575 [Bacteroidetes bacterium]|nr:MAG: hypothetical protein D6722_22575 [Bacteroidota bacterium]
MSKQVIEKLIPPALKLIGSTLQNPEDGSVPKVYKGYISSMGASLNQSGLLPTLAIFSAEDSNDEGDRWKFMIILTDLLKSYWPARYAGIDTQKDPHGKGLAKRLWLLHYVSHGSGLQEEQLPGFYRQVRQDLTQASVAVKLALRTYTLK